MARRSHHSAQKRRRELAKQAKRKNKTERRETRTDVDQDDLVKQYLGIPEEEVEGEGEGDEAEEGTEEDGTDQE